MKFCAKIGSFILGIIIGFVLIVGGIGLGGYLVLTKEGMVGTVADKVEAFNPTEEVAEKSLLEYGKTIFDTIKKFEDTTFGTIEDTVGINITNTLADALGLDADVLRQSTVGTVADNILDGYTIVTLQDKFGITLPDLPMFEDTVFLNKPIREAFNYLSEQLNFDTMTVRELNAKFGVTLGDMLSKPEFLDVPINQLGDKVSTSPLHTFVAITLNAEVDRYLAEHVATVATIEGVTYLSLDGWKAGKTAFALAEDKSNLGVGAAFVFDNPADLFASTFYFDDVVDGDGKVVTTAKELQAQWIEAYNTVEGNQPIVEFWQYAIDNKDIYDAVMADNASYVREWTLEQWLDSQDYVDETAADYIAFVTNNYEGVLIEEEAIKEAYFEQVIWTSVAAEAWKGEHPEGTMSDYKENLFDDAYDTINYYDYMPSFAAPVVPTVVVTETEGKDGAAINEEYRQSIPVASNRTLQYLYYAVVGSDGEDGLNAYMNNMTLDDATEIKDTDHVLLQRIKYEKIVNLGTAVTDQVDNMALNELMSIVTDADVAYENSLYVTTDEARNAAIALLDPTSAGAYSVDNPSGVYFVDRAAQQEWIAAQAAEGKVFYDYQEWARDTKNAGKRIFATTAELSEEYTKYTSANPDTTMTQEEFGIALDALTILFALPYAPTVDAGYIARTPSNKMLQAIASATPKTLNDRVTNLTLVDIFGEHSDGAMSLVSRYTKLDNISTAMTDAMQTATMGKLMEVGILTNIDFSGLTPTQIENIEGLTIEGMVNAYINALKGMTP